MKPQTDIRDRYEIIATAKTGDTGTVVVAHADDATDAETKYDNVAEMECWRSVWVRHRHIVETIRNGTPPGFTVFIKWVRDFEGEPERHDFLTRGPAMAFAQDGNDPAIMSAVYVFDHRSGATIWEWKG